MKIERAIIGGSGLYEVEGAKIIKELVIETPWGIPSDAVTIAEIDGHQAAFLPRHGKGHTTLPGEVNSRANIAALKSLGVEEIYSFSAVGSLKEEIAPGDFAIPDQVIDRTRQRPGSFFGEGIVGHVAFADPFCGRLQEIIEKSMAESLSIKLHKKQTLICMEGPAFSTRAESNLYRSWGAGLINMSTLPEAKLAREAEICYAVICMCTDYDCWKVDEEHVTIEKVIATMKLNTGHAKELIKAIVTAPKSERHCSCREASKYAVMTPRAVMSDTALKKLKFILPEYF